MNLRHLSDEQHKKLGQLLSSELAHPSDLQRASVIIYSMIKNNYPFDDTDIDLAIEVSGEKYSYHINKFLMEMIDTFKILVPALENPAQ